MELESAIRELQELSANLIERDSWLVNKLLDEIRLAEGFESNKQFREAKYTAMAALVNLREILSESDGHGASGTYAVLREELQRLASLPDSSSGSPVLRTDGRDASSSSAYPFGTPVRIEDTAVLEKYSRPRWRYHHPVQAEQLSFARKVSKVIEVSIYHGGDYLYKLELCPAYYWHEECLKPT